MTERELDWRRTKPALALICNHFWNTCTLWVRKLPKLKLIVLHLELGNSSGSLGPFISTRKWFISVTSWSKRIAQVFSKVAPRIVPCKVTWLSKLLHFSPCLRFHLPENRNISLMFLWVASVCSLYTSVMYVPTNGLWLFLDSICIYAITYPIACVTCLCVSRMANIITVPYTWVYHGYFPHYPW